MAINAGTISAFLELNTSNFSAGIASANSQLQALSDDNLNAAEKIKGVGGALTTIGGTLTKNWTVPLVGAGVAATTVAANFDAGMSKVQAISGATGEELDKLRDKAREMGAKTKFSASEAADAMSYMAMAGWKTGDMLDGIEGIMNLAAASGEDLATTSDIVTDALTAFGLSAKDSAHFSDILAAASSNANTNVSLMGETFKYVAPVAGALGISAEDTAEAVGLMANAGIKGSQAGTSLRSILTRLATDAGASSKSLGALGVLTEELGVEFYDANGKVRDFGDILKDARKQWKSLSEEDASRFAKKIAGEEGISAWLSMMNAAPEDIAKLSGAISNCDGTAKRMADTMNDNLQGQLTVLKSQTEEVAIAFGEELMPVAQDLVGKASEAVQWFGSLDSGAKRLIVNAGLVTASLGPVLMITGKLTSGVGALMTTAGGAVTAFTAAGGGAAGLGAALTSIVTPAGWVVLGLAAVTAAGVALYAAHRDATKGTRELGEAMKGAAGYAEDFQTGLSSASGSVDSFTSNLNAGFNIDDIKTKISEVQGKITAITSKATAERRELTKSEIKQLDEYFQKLRELTDQEFEFYSSKLGAVESIIDSGMEMTKENSQKVIAEAKSAKQEALDLAWDAYEQEIAIAEIKYDKESQEYKNATAAAKQHYNDKVQIIGDSYAQIVSKVTGAYAKQNLLDSDFFSKLKAHNDAVEAENQRHNEKVAEIQKIALSAPGRAADESRQEMERHNREMNRLNGELADSFDDSAQEIVGTLMALVADVQANNGQMTEDTRAFAEAFLACYDSLPEDVKAPMSETVELLRQAMDDAATVTEENAPRMKEAVQKVVTDTLGPFDELPEGATEASQNAVDGVIGTFDDGENQGRLITSVKGLIQLIPDTSNSTMESHSPSRVMQRIGGFAIDGLIGGMESKKSSVVSSIGGIMQNMLTAAQGVDFTPVGSNIVGGILSGLNARKNSLLATAGSLANSISTKIKSALKINSPSRVMMEIGEFTTAGMELGLMKGSQSLYETASAISRDTAEALSGITPTVHTDFSGSFAEDKLDRLLEAVERLADSRPTMEIDGRPFGRLVREYV